MPWFWPHLSPTAEGRGECNASKRWEQNFGQAAGRWIQDKKVHVCILLQLWRLKVRQKQGRTQV